MNLRVTFLFFYFLFLTLGVIDGHLSLVTEGRGGTVELWMMKEYRVKSSWGVGTII